MNNIQKRRKANGRYEYIGYIGAFGSVYVERCAQGWQTKPSGYFKQYKAATLRALDSLLDCKDS